MAELNMDCVRSLLLFLEENQRYREHGRVVGLKMKNIRHQMEEYSYEHLYEAAQYLLDKNLVIVEGNGIGKTPAHYTFKGITPQGHELLKAMRDDTVWQRAKPHLSNFTKTASELIQFLLAVRK